jgi:hypothetical protein
VTDGGRKMKKKINILHAIITEDTLLLETNEPINDLVPGEQILVDSDHYAFIYLMEQQEDYTYIVLPEQIWSSLKQAQEKMLRVMIGNNDHQMELSQFHEEFEYVINNIKGNSNYGSEMVAKVERMF